MQAPRISLRNLVGISVLILLLMVSARGKTVMVLSANVPFGFEAGSASLPAGTYQFKVESTEKSLVISSAKSGETKVPIIAQLAGASLFKDTGLVFNVVEGRHVLAEVWIPDQGGALVNVTPKEHGHEVVMAVVSGATARLTGKGIFESTCARCHGQMGKGNPAADKFFGTPIPRLDSAYVQNKSNAELRDIISHGKSLMDPVRMGQGPLQHLLYPESVDDVIRYVRTLKQQ